MRMDKVYFLFLMILCKYLVNLQIDLGICRKIFMFEVMVVLLWDFIEKIVFLILSNVLVESCYLLLVFFENFFWN